MRSDIKELAQALMEASRRRGEAGVDFAGHQWDAAKGASARSKHRAERCIGDQPWTSVGLAFGAGLFIGLLLKK